MADKKYNIIKTIQSDGPFGFVNWVNISFLTPQKLEQTKLLDVIGLKIHDGYTTEEIAKNDAKVLKEKTNSTTFIRLKQVSYILGTMLLDPIVLSTMITN